MAVPPTLLPKNTPDWRTAKSLDPNKRTALFLQQLGYRVKLVEYYDGMARVKRDFLGCADLLAMQDGFKVLIQATTKQHHKERARKIQALIDAGELICEWLKRDQLWVISWCDPRPDYPRYVPLVEAMTLNGTEIKDLDIADA